MTDVKLLLLLLSALVAFHTVHGERRLVIDTGASGVVAFSQPTTDAEFSEEDTVLDASPGSNGRRSCYLGDDLLYTDEDSVYDGDGESVASTPLAESIWGLACCCDMVAITYTDSTTNGLTIDIFKRDSTGPFVRHILQEPVVGEAVVKCSTQASMFIVLSTSTVWGISLDDLQTPLFETELATPLSNQPTCVTFRSAGDFVDLFVSVINLNVVQAIRMNSAYEVMSRTQFDLGIEFIPYNVYCLDLDGFGDDLFLIARRLGLDTYSVWLVNADEVIDEGATATEYEEITGVSVGSPLVNGLSVCGDDCAQYDCGTPPLPECTCVNPCGFCVYDSTVCQCEDSRDEECIYNEEAAETCEQCRERLDASLLVRNPLAERETGDIEVYGVMAGEGGTITISREVAIGRYDPDNWPLPFDADASDKTVAGLTVSGFNAPPRGSLRGSRFGVFRGDFGPIDEETQRPAIISGIVTENSGFTNAIYTKTVSRGDDVTLEASMVDRLLQYESSLMWRLTQISPETGEPLDPVTPDCDFDSDKLTCGLEDVTKELDEGVYEVFRPARRLRNWHPIFYLYVRECKEGLYGPTCSRECPACAHGQCDEKCGECVCYPGWTGDDCDTPCNSAGDIGDSCGVACSDIFRGSTMCEGILICRPDQTGCACRSGLQPPECLLPCEEGYWGENCLKECSCETPGPCNPRTGACVP